MKVLHIHLTTGYFNDNMAYQENMLIKFHKKLGCDVTMITGPYEIIGNDVVYVGKKRYVNDEGVEIIRLRMRKGQTYKNRIKKYEKFYFYIVENQPDVIFAHGCQFLDILAVKKYMKNNRRTVLFIDNHADYFNSARTWISKNILHRILWRYCAKQLVLYTNKFYGVLPARVDFLTELYGLPKEKCELLLMGSDDELASMASCKDMKRAIREKYNIGKEDFLIVTGGKINKWRPQVVLLEQAITKMGRSNIKLLIFGSVVPELEEQVMSLCGDHIKYIGWLSVEDSYGVIGAADLAVYPGGHSTLWEQTAGQGIPMVLKHWQGITHLDVGGNIKYLYNDSIEEISRVLLEIVDSPRIYIEMSKCAFDKKDIFSYRNIAEKCLQRRV